MCHVLLAGGDPQGRHVLIWHGAVGGKKFRNENWPSAAQTHCSQLYISNLNAHSAMQIVTGDDASLTGQAANARHAVGLPRRHLGAHTAVLDAEA